MGAVIGAQVSGSPAGSETEFALARMSSGREGGGQCRKPPGAASPPHQGPSGWIESWVLAGQAQVALPGSLLPLCHCGPDIVFKK